MATPSEWRRLLDTMASDGALAPVWRATFEAVPRAQFLPRMIWLDPQDDAHYQPVDRETEPERWHAAAVSDIAIVTQLNNGGPRLDDDPWDTATSSSSMPSMVADMLERLDVQDGHTVLEAGTGTGWNTALLSRRLGSSNVASVEIDPAVAREARRALHQAGYTPVLAVGDAAFAVPTRPGGWDRLISTCAVRRIPQAWRRAIRPSGVILTPMTTDMGGGALVRLVADAEGGLMGESVGPAAFMSMRSQPRTVPRHDLYLTEPWPGDGVRTTTTLSPADLLENDAYWSRSFWVGMTLPDVAMTTERFDGGYTVWLYDTGDTKSWASVDFYADGRTEFEVHQSGPRTLWAEVETACAAYEAAPERYGQPLML